MAYDILGGNLIFLISLPRSGSTLLQSMLGGHERVGTLPEPWVMLHPAYLFKRRGHSAEYDASLCRGAVREYLDLVDGRGDELYLEAVREMARVLYTPAFAKTGKPLFLDKTPRYYNIIDELGALFPQAHFILLKRHPLAILSSIWQTWYAGKPVEAITDTAHYTEDLIKGPALMAAGATALRARGCKVSELSYEQLLTDPDATLAGLLADMGLDHDPALINYGDKDIVYGNFGDQTKVRELDRPLTSNRDSWQQVMAGSEQLRAYSRQYLRALGRDTFGAFGYDYDAALDVASDTGRAVAMDAAAATQAVGRLFDKVWVVSLPSSQERRDYVVGHLAEAGMGPFEFFDATPADAPEVAAAEAAGEVFRYPPCFRCGKLDCGNPDCNNFLIPAQIATFLTYRRLWRTIAEGDAERVLIVEDDVRFEPHAARVLNELADAVVAGQVPFRAGHACLLRLGWASCEEHQQHDAPLQIDSTVRMANPCHAVTREFARALIARDTGIHHTVDVYQHARAPQAGEAYTVLPPLASELSWSSGAFASTIHPKTKRSDYLRAQQDAAAAERHDAMVRDHLKKKYFRPLLIVGHPRCGTGYAAALCGQLGLDVGHERSGADGISSWMFAVDAPSSPYALDEVARTRRALVWRHLLMPVRDLATAVGSVMRDSEHAPPSYDFRRTHIREQLGVDLSDLASPLARAVWSVTSWARILLAQQPDLWFRIEDGAPRVASFMVEHWLCPPGVLERPLDTSPVNADKPYQGRRYPKPEVSRADWLALDEATRAEAAWYCEQFGYPLPWAAQADLLKEDSRAE